MVLQMEILSKEMIKPSSPTPHHLRELKLSLLDQIASSARVPFLLFYRTDESGEKSRQLKQSLSDTLTAFYPLAGQIHENTSINCNDNGAEFIEARVHARVSDFLDDLKLEELKQLVPIDPSGENGNMVLSVQANLFACGGIVVGFAMSHKSGDAVSMAEFMKAWAAACRGETEMIVQPAFDLATHFPPQDLPSIYGSEMVVGSQPEKVVTKRLVFNNEKLAELKMAISSAPGSKLKDPTRVEAATAYIWKHFIGVTQQKVSAAAHVVHIRPRMIPPLPESSFGNCAIVTPPMVLSNDNDHDPEMHHIAYLIRNGIRGINEDYVKEEVQADGQRYFAGLMQSMGQVFMNGTTLYGFTSWCRFPVYEVDYGWGKPVWVCTTFSIKNSVIFMSTPCGEGIEAWINLLEDDMKVFDL